MTDAMERAKARVLLVGARAGRRGLIGLVRRSSEGERLLLEFAGVDVARLMRG